MPLNVICIKLWWTCRGECGLIVTYTCENVRMMRRLSWEVASYSHTVPSEYVGWSSDSFHLSEVALLSQSRPCLLTSDIFLPLLCRLLDSSLHFHSSSDHLGSPCSSLHLVPLSFNMLLIFFLFILQCWALFLSHSEFFCFTRSLNLFLRDSITKWEEERCGELACVCLCLFGAIQWWN